MPLIPALRRQRQADLCEIKDRLVYRASARTGSKATQRKPVSKNKTKTNNTNQPTKKKNPYIIKINFTQFSLHCWV